LRKIQDMEADLGERVRLYALSHSIDAHTPAHTHTLHLPRDLPACETDRPASSISWSMEKAPVLISSLSRAAAAFAESVCKCTSVSVRMVQAMCLL
jgi:hypothetical protein